MHRSLNVPVSSRPKAMLATVLSPARAMPANPGLPVSPIQLLELP
jgi:hypothetical protein